MALWSSDRKTQISGFPGGATKQNPYGQAQPVQPQSQGTPYGSPTKPPPAGMVYNKAPSSQPANFSAYAPQQQANFSAYQPAQQASSNPFAQYNPQQTGNFVQQQMGLPSFQFTATDSFGNTYDNPAALTAQQGAMAQALNAQRAQQIQSGNIGQLNPMAAYQQAQNMVQGGWTNPFAQPPALPGGQGQAQPVPPPSQGTPYGTGLGSIGTSLESHGYLGPAGGYGSRPWDNNYGQGWGPGVPILKGLAPSQGRDASQMLGPPSPPAPAPPDPKRQRDQAAYEELMQQIRMGGGSMADNMRADRRRADLERRLGMTQAPAQPGAAQPVPPPSQGTRYGTPPDQRGMGRTHQFIDSDGDGVDDRDQDGPGMPRYGAPPRRRGFERDAVGMPVLRAPQVWTNPSDPEWLKRELQSKPDTRPVVWDEANRRYIKNPYLAGGPARPGPSAPPGEALPYVPLNDVLPWDTATMGFASRPRAAAPPWRYEGGFAYTRR